MTIADLIRESNETARAKGWWDTDRGFPEEVALFHSELSEALEEFRGGAAFNAIAFEGPSNKPVGIAVELADVLIRIADCCGQRGIPLEEALRRKLEYNRSRPMRHGGKTC